MKRRLHTTAALALALAGPAAALADGGPIGIDHRINYDNSGIWNRRYQTAVEVVLPLTVAGLALWEGDGNRLGHTSWQSVDSMLIGTVAATGLKYAFSRARPSQTDNPNSFFQGSGHDSFPSNQTMLVTTAVVPYLLEYGSEQPAVWALAALPAYTAVARVKAQAHWQTDVLASLLIGTGVGYYAHTRKTSLTVGLLPGGFSVGWSKRF